MSHYCRNCGKWAFRRCSVCRSSRTWFCSQDCQNKLWPIHIFECDTLQPIHTGYHLARACLRDVFPDHPQTCEDYGFNRVTTAESRLKLLDLYIDLIVYRDITPNTIHDWRINGTLTEMITTTYWQVEAEEGIYRWFLENQCIFEPSWKFILQVFAGKYKWSPTKSVHLHPDKHRSPVFFPPELYRPIIETVDSKADLYNLLFVSRIVSYEAERVLYHTIGITMEHKRIRTLMRLFLHLSRCPRAARYVRELEISGGSTFAPSWNWDRLEFHDPVQSAVQDSGDYSLNRALCALTRLRVLKLSNWIWSGDGYIFSDCTFKLEVLKLTDYSADKIPHIDVTQVKELYLRRNNLEQTLRRAFPSLQILTASPFEFLRLGTLNANNVKALELRNESSDDYIEEETFTSIISLKIHTIYEDWLLPFPSLRFLQTCVGEWDLASDERLSQMLRTLAALKNLEKLSLVTYSTISRYPQDVHLQFFAAINSLKELTISCDMPNGPLTWSDQLWDSSVGTLSKELKKSLLRVRGGQLWERGGICSKSVDISAACFKDEWKNPRWL